MEKIDLKKQLSAIYKAKPNTPAFVSVPALQYLMIDGVGDPNTAKSYHDAISALFSTAYTLKSSAKKGPLQTDFTVMPLQALWWADDMADFTSQTKDNWHWTAMIAVPDFISPEFFCDTLGQVKAKKPNSALDLLRLETLEEGDAAQVMYIGPYSDEGPTIAALHDSILAQGYELAGCHHEIYLSDARRTAPEKLKTIIRQPFRTPV